MALTWKQLATEEPYPGVDLWIRVYWYQGTPVAAQYDATNQEFTNNENGIVYPAWAISRWAYPAGYTPPTNEPEVDQYIDGLTTPLSDTNIGYLNTLVETLKADLEIDTLNEFFECIWLRAAQTEEVCLKNLVQDDYHSTAVNAPTFTQYEGYQGNASSQYLQTGFNPNTDANIIAANDVTLICTVLNNDGSSRCEFGADTGYANDVLYAGSRWGSAMYYGVNQDAETTKGNVDSLAHWIYTRRGNTDSEVYKNGVSFDTNSNSVSAVANFELYELARNHAGSVDSYSSKKVAITAVCKGVTDQQASDITDAFEAYLDSIGSGIIT